MPWERARLLARSQRGALDMGSCIRSHWWRRQLWPSRSYSLDVRQLSHKLGSTSAHFDPMLPVQETRLVQKPLGSMRRRRSPSGAGADCGPSGPLRGLNAELSGISSGWIGLSVRTRESERIRHRKSDVVRHAVDKLVG